jgi:hypothetical protein
VIGALSKINTIFDEFCVIVEGENEKLERGRERMKQKGPSRKGRHGEGVE